MIFYVFLCFEKRCALISIMCCNLIQAGEIYEISPREKTRSLFKENGLDYLREIVCYLKSCRTCRGSRITVFAESLSGEIYFIERIRSKNVKSFLTINKVVKKVKKFIPGISGSSGIPLKYFDRGRKLACNVSFSSLKIAPYDNEILNDLKHLKLESFSLA